MLYWTLKILLWPLVWLAFLCPHIRGLHNLKSKGGAIVICNHTTLLDPVVLIWMLPRTIHFMAKRQLFEGGFKRWFFRGMKAIPVNRDGSDLAAVKECLALLKKGGLVGIFPEGTRSKTQEMLPFEKGVAFLALRARVPVIPMAITRNYKVLNHPKIIMGEPISLEEYHGKRMTGELMEEVTARLYEAVRHLSEDIRK